MARRIEGLEAVRGFAAVYIAVGHLILDGLTSAPKALRFAFGFGQEAVIVFFLLSGFVIELSAGGRWKGVGDYVRRRALRIFPLYLFALAVAYVATGLLGGGWDLQGQTLVGNIAMLQDARYLKPGVMFPTYKGDSAFWSLSYEWWFYLLYIPFRGRANATVEIGFLSVGAAALYLFAPLGALLYLIYFAVWWSGVSMAREWRQHERITFRGQRASLASLFVLALPFAAATGMAMARHQPLSPGVHPVLEGRHMIMGFVLILLTLVAYRWRQPRLLVPVSRALASLGAISYALYVLHFPLLVEGGVTSWTTLAFRAALLIVMCIVLELGVQPHIARRFGGIRSSGARTSSS